MVLKIKLWNNQGWVLDYNEADRFLSIEAPGKSRKNVLQM